LYLVRAGEVGELRGLRDEVVTARHQTTAFSKAVDELKRRLMAMQEVNQRLRVMLGITAHKPEDLFNGQGGEETPLLENEMVPTSYPEDPEQIQISDADIFPLPDEQLLAGDDLARQVKEDLARLREQAEDQERTLEVLAQAAKEKADRWDHTPSIWPVKGWITSAFGARISPFTGQRAFHDALDIGAAPNTPVLSPAAGRVYSTGFDPRMGNVVSIDHGFGIRTQYGHLAKILVTRGQKIERGDAVGLVGSTGRTTGPHLHYLVKVNGRSVNPMRYILN
ncbi:MAG: M23 family metallopeptidase, partial [Nitrospirales bacterium]